MTLKIEVPHAALILQDEIRRSEEAKYDHRLHAILLVVNGMSPPRAAGILGDSERTVRYWAQRFNEEGLQGLIEIERLGRPSRLTDRQMEAIDKQLYSMMNRLLGSGFVEKREGIYVIADPLLEVAL